MAAKIKSKEITGPKLIKCFPDGEYRPETDVVYLHDGMPCFSKDEGLFKDKYTGEYGHLNYGKNITLLTESGKISPAIPKDHYVPIDGTSSTFALNTDVAEKYGLKEDFFAGKLIPTSKASLSVPDKYIKFKHPVVPSTLIDEIKFGKKSPTNIISEGKSYTFGVEIETSGGRLPSYARIDLNTDCQYDGSILTDGGSKDYGGEYTTGVLFGDAGFRQLYLILKELSKRCCINKTCSVHVHLGNIIFNKENTVLLYKMFSLLEEELFSMVTPSRKNREHCKKIRKLNINLSKRGIPYRALINSYYNTIVKIVSVVDKEPCSEMNKRHNHPLGRTCNYDKSTPRYWWVNFVPALFNIKGVGNYTIEVRNHSASLDYVVIRNWVLICMAIVSFVENNKKIAIECKSIRLSDILKSEYRLKSNYLIEYVESRKKLFNGDSAVSNEVDEYKASKYSDYSKKGSLMDVVKI